MTNHTPEHCKNCKPEFIEDEDIKTPIRNPTCINDSCPCHQPQEESISKTKTGKNIALAGTEENMTYNGVPLPIVQEESWEIEFDNKFQTQHEGYKTVTFVEGGDDTKDFIRSLLAHQKQELIAELKKLEPTSEQGYYDADVIYIKGWKAALSTFIEAIKGK